jgi:hypothetical protein
MKSNEHSDRLDLARGLPTTATDVEALRAVRSTRMTDEQYVRFIESLEPPDRATLAAKRGPRGEPFRL